MFSLSLWFSVMQGQFRVEKPLKFFNVFYGVTLLTTKCELFFVITTELCRKEIAKWSQFKFLLVTLFQNTFTRHLESVIVSQNYSRIASVVTPILRYSNDTCFFYYNQFTNVGVKTCTVEFCSIYFHSFLMYLSLL